MNKTIKVAVVINKDGDYHAFGKSESSDAALRFAVAGFKKRGGKIIVIEVPIIEDK